MWKPVGSSVPRLAASSSHLAMTAAVHSAGLSVPVGSRSRLLVTALYGPLADRRNDNERQDQDPSGAGDMPPSQAHEWWPIDVDQWLTVSAAFHASTVGQVGCGDVALRHLARPHVALADLYDAARWDMGRVGARLVALAAEVRAEGSPSDRIDDNSGNNDADVVHVVHEGRHTLGLPCAEWRAFCRLVAQRDTALRRALDVDPTVYGARGSFVVTSILRTEEALGRRWRLDPALPDPDAVAALRRSFMSIADARRRAPIAA
ncbi:hypothetical protein pqer_cds_1041 [Pandoravirus quercus]|uniref:Uncharacterized protein n=1 Tax=Pandoravirus quercus TaxID=2107709 RepID=A0A2U7UAJ3_9VIRU|nr:hypothetical protein pqer_cds_1041 [Pandoravirus quercus]AVK75463.1 hypothetical protein pqer_cds_1041 [Pandoravirus quercus]